MATGIPSDILTEVSITINYNDENVVSLCYTLVKMHDLLQVVDRREQCCAANYEQCCASNYEQCCAAPSEQCFAANCEQ